MLIRSNYSLFVLFIFLLPPWMGHASILEKKISIKANNQPVIEILHEIEKIGDVVFSFKSDAFDKQRKISFESDNMTISEILEIIFKAEPLKYKEVGNQIVLLNIIKNKEVQETILQKPDEGTEVKIINDTIFRYINTTNIKVYDTVRYVFFDTIRAKPEPVKHNFSVELGIAPILHFPDYMVNDPDYDEITNLLNASTKPVFSYGFSGKINTSINSLKLTTGLSFSVIRENLDIQFFDTSLTALYETKRTWITELDTSFYKIIEGTGGKPGGADTVWTFIYFKTPVDSIITTNKIDTAEINSSGINSMVFLSFPITFGWEKQLSEKLAFTLNTGPSIDLLIAKKGSIVYPSPVIKLEDFSTIPLIKINLSWLINTGIYFKINQEWSTCFLVNYNHSLQSIFSPNFPYKRYNKSLGFSIGCSYSF